MVKVRPSYVYDTELRNAMERFIKHIKDRADDCFDDYFLCRTKGNCDRQHVWNWLKLFVLYLHMGRVGFMTFLVRDGG